MPSNPNPNPNSEKMKTESTTTTHDGASDTPWKSLTLPANSAWADIRPMAASKTNALTLQLKATTAFREYLNSDDDSGQDSDEEDVDYWPDPGAERFQLFRRIFVEDGELRRYFEENYKAGEFFCFVCGGIGKKSSGRSFKSCQGLLQHVAAMSKVERSQSHRAFGLVVCKVLGWDFDQIPSVVLKGEPLGRTLGAYASVEKGEIASGDVKDNVEVPSDNGAGLIGNESSSGKGRIGSKGGLSRDDEKGLVVIGTSEVGRNENKSTIQLCSEGKAGSGNQAKEEKASEDSDNVEKDVSEDGNEEEEEEDPSEEEEDEDPSENGNGDEEEDPDEVEEEDPDEVEEEDPNEVEEEDPSEEGSEEEEEEEDPSEDEDGDGNDNKDENKSGAKESKRSTVSKSCSLDQPMSQLGITQGFNQPLGSSSGWPRGGAVVKNTSANMEWPVLTPKSAISLSPEEQTMLASDKLQHKAVKLCKDFLRTRYSLDRCDNNNEEEKEQEEDPSEDSESENEGEDEDASGDSKEFNFFSKLFSEDVKLRDFYANDRGSRDFCCLVCGGVGKKDWKRFTSVALVQHSTAISKTRKKRAHRAYGEVICEVLGWDKNRLPSIVMRSESHGQDQPWMKLHAVRRCSVEGMI